jgi:hypothetical protein
MPDERPILAAEVIREEAASSLLVIQSNPRAKLAESQWRILWQLVREAKAARIPWGEFTAGPWHISRDGDGSPPVLMAGGFGVPLWPPWEQRYASDLPRMLNWAGVPQPDGGMENDRQSNS